MDLFVSEMSRKTRRILAVRASVRGVSNRARTAIIGVRSTGPGVRQVLPSDREASLSSRPATTTARASSAASRYASLGAPATAASPRTASTTIRASAFIPRGAPCTASAYCVESRQALPRARTFAVGPHRTLSAAHLFATSPLRASWLKLSASTSVRHGNAAFRNSTPRVRDARSASPIEQPPTPPDLRVNNRQKRTLDALLERRVRPGHRRNQKRAAPLQQ